MRVTHGKSDFSVHPCTFATRPDWLCPPEFELGVGDFEDPFARLTSKLQKILMRFCLKLPRCGTLSFVSCVNKNCRESP